MEEKPRPCPHCGKSGPVRVGTVREFSFNDNDSDNAYQVVCSFNDGGCGASGGVRDNRHAALIAWNQSKASEVDANEVDVGDILVGKIDVSVRWHDGCLEEFEASEVRFGSDLLWMRLTNGKNRHIPLRSVRWFSSTPESHAKN